MPTLTTLLLADAIGKAESAKPKTPKPGGSTRGDRERIDEHLEAKQKEEENKQKAPPPDADLSSPEQVAHDRHADAARDLKRRAREASYNALELDNSKASHKKAAKAHRAAAKASEAALGSAMDPRAKSEFRASQHSHSLHAAYHEKMSHSSDDERKASAAKGKEEKDGHVHKGDYMPTLTTMLLTDSVSKKRKRLTGPDHSLYGPKPDPTPEELKRDQAKCKRLGKAYLRHYAKTTR